MGDYLEQLTRMYIPMMQAAQEAGLIKSFKILRGGYSNMDDFDLMLLVETENMAMMDEDPERDARWDAVREKVRASLGGEDAEDEIQATYRKIRTIQGQKLMRELVRKGCRPTDEQSPRHRRCIPLRRWRPGGPTTKHDGPHPPSPDRDSRHADPGQRRIALFPLPDRRSLRPGHRQHGIPCTGGRLDMSPGVAQRRLGRPDGGLGPSHRPWRTASQGATRTGGSRPAALRLRGPDGLLGGSIRPDLVSAQGRLSPTAPPV